MAVNVDVIGIEELLKKLNDMRSPAEIEAIAYTATKKESSVISDLARDNAFQSLHSDSGTLLAAFAIKRVRYGSKLGYTIGMRAGNKRNKPSAVRPKGVSVKAHRAKDDAFYWTFLESGTAHIAPRSFYRKAIAQNRGIATTGIIQAGKRAIAKAASRALKKHGSGKSRTAMHAGGK